jgi:hypothetical protein
MTQLQILQEICYLLQTNHPATDVMGIKSAAAYMDVSPNFLRELIGRHKIPYAPLKGRKSRGRILLRKIDLDAFLRSQLVNGSEDALALADGRRKPKIGGVR